MQLVGVRAVASEGIFVGTLCSEGAAVAAAVDRWRRWFGCGVCGAGLVNALQLRREFGVKLLPVVGSVIEGFWKLGGEL